MTERFNWLNNNNNNNVCLYFVRSGVANNPRDDVQSAGEYRGPADPPPHGAADEAGQGEAAGPGAVGPALQGTVTIAPVT